MTTMNNREITLEFVTVFCVGDVNALAPLLEHDLQFSRPFSNSTRPRRIWTF